MVLGTLTPHNHTTTTQRTDVHEVSAVRVQLYCCDEEESESIIVNQKTHTLEGSGHRAKCAAFMVASSSQGTAVEASHGDDPGMAESKAHEMDGEPTVGTAVSNDSGGGGGRRKGTGSKWQEGAPVINPRHV